MAVTIEILQLEAIERMGQMLSDEIVDAVTAKVALGARAEWIRLAGESSLTTTKREYINGIQQIHKEKSGVYRITLMGSLPNVIEGGHPGGDMRDWLLGPNVPIWTPGGRGKRRMADGSGYYRSIPFSHAGPSATGAGGQAPMGSAYSDHELIASARKLGRDVFEQAKQLAPAGDPSASSEEKRLTDPYTVQGRGKKQTTMAVPKLQPEHSTDIYSGMIRNVQVDVKGRESSSFVTFRTISTKSGTDKWMRKPTEGLHLATQVSEYVARIAPQAFQEYVSSR